MRASLSVRGYSRGGGRGGKRRYHGDTRESNAFYVEERRGGNGGVGRDSGDGMGMGFAVRQLDINPGASGTQSATSDELDVC